MELIQCNRKTKELNIKTIILESDEKPAIIGITDKKVNAG